MEQGRLQAVRSTAHHLENEKNLDLRRAGAVGEWLAALNPVEKAPPAVIESTDEFRRLGLRSMDAFRLAWAHYLKADTLVTCDDRFLTRSQRLAERFGVRVQDPITFVSEMGL